MIALSSASVQFHEEQHFPRGAMLAMLGGSVAFILVVFAITGIGVVSWTSAAVLAVTLVPFGFVMALRLITSVENGVQSERMPEPASWFLGTL